KGTRSKEVTKLQNAYNDYASKNGKSTILVDGIFGNQTQGAVKEITGRNSTTLDEFLLIIKSK
ncbi:MAG: hypothetical protein MK066_14620, partial [Crocinitomicaceae bacterium]|nr:hypothetical protein [Crocinitomicaceae bacterium]